jgi:hypothetical protein
MKTIKMFLLTACTIGCMAMSHTMQAQPNPHQGTPGYDGGQTINPGSPENNPQDTLARPGQPRTPAPVPSTTPRNQQPTAPGNPDTTLGAPPTQMPRSSPNTPGNTNPPGTGPRTPGGTTPGGTAPTNPGMPPQ